MVGKRRIDVMLSSTFKDLELHRDAVLEAVRDFDLNPIAQEKDKGDALDADVIDVSLGKVDAAHLYLGVIGARYGQRPVCPDRNPERLSLTELEYRRAAGRPIPRLMFLMADDHPLTLAENRQIRAEGEEAHKLLDAFIVRVKKDRLTGRFASPDDLREQVKDSLRKLLKSMPADEQSTPTTPALPPSPDDSAPTGPPAFHYVRKPYVEKQGFAGRAAELALIDGWAAGPDAMLLFQAIGGMGKSMLTWHWIKTRAAAVRADWAGMLWYSFYEQGADLNDFLVHALAYIHHERPAKFRGRRTLDLGDQLLRALDERPWLLILDGLERVLVAYNRAGKEHMTDEEADVVRDAMGLDREPRVCFRPEDDDVLAILATATRGKLLASSRLTPMTLTSAGRPIPGVQHEALQGLAPEDAEQVLRNAKIRGEGWRMQRFLSEQFEGHPLSVGAVAGQVNAFLDARGDFDRWVEHPRGGADPGLIAKDLRGRQNHILARAFDDLGEDEKALLGAIAMANIDLPMDVLRILNPMRPIEPKTVAPPKILTEEDQFSSYDHFALLEILRSAKDDGARIEAQEKLDAFRREDFARQQERYAAFLAEHETWPEKAKAADDWLDRTLPKLEARGLLQYDPQAASLDMHPAIRHTVLLGLSADARSSTGSHVSDALSSRPVKPFAEARTRDDLALLLTRVEALNTAGKLDQGWELHKNSGLRRALFRLGYAHERLELLKAYFPDGLDLAPAVKDDHALLLGETAGALCEAGQPGAAIPLAIQAIRVCIAEDDSSVVTDLGNLANYLAAERRRAEDERLLALAVRLAEAVENEDHWLWLKGLQAYTFIESNRLAEARSVLAALRAKLVPGQGEPQREAALLRYELDLAERAGRLDVATATQTLDRLRALGHRRPERTGLEIIARWHQQHGRHDDSLATLGDLFALANDIGSPELPRYEALRALSLAAIARTEDARRIAERADRGAKPPHLELARLYLSLGAHDKARTHAIAGYTEAWGEGPPHHHHWNLEDCRSVLAAVGAPEPKLPPFDPTRIKPFDFEADVEKLIAKELAKKAEREAMEAKRAAQRAEREAKTQVLAGREALAARLQGPTLPAAAASLSAPSEPVALTPAPRRRRVGRVALLLLVLIAALAVALTVTGLADVPALATAARDALVLLVR